METKAAKNERIGISPEKFVCKVGYNPEEGRIKCLGGVASQKRSYVTQEMAGEQQEKRACGAGQEVDEGQEDIHSLFLNACFTAGVGMASEKLGKSVLGLDGKAFCEGSRSQRLLMAKRELLADFVLFFYLNILMTHALKGTQCDDCTLRPFPHQEEDRKV